ncbi:hypothetical protein [Persicitalea sp.]|uniref:hypothetical protein n=1 Tax=Persicitalea sp. TaxID=3100273 RepID=UPI003593BF89
MKFLITGIFVAFVSYYFLYSHIFYCQTVAFSSFEKINEKLYVSAGTDAAQRQRMYEAVGKARQRIEAFWGKSLGNATLILCSNPEEYQKYCHSSEGAGCSLGTPWGDSYIVLNLFGLNVDVVSHEMCHDELFTRLGWWKTTTQIPQWFNEGLALMLDRRFVPETEPMKRYLSYKDEWLYLTHGAQEVLELKNLKTMRGFFGGNQRHVMLAYMSAGMEVSYWLLLTGPESVRALLDTLRRGGDFAETYGNLKTAGESQRRVPPSFYPLR